MTKGGLPSWGLGEGLTTPHRKETASYEVCERFIDQLSDYKLLRKDSVARS
jgi:hypothetical protein